MVSRGHVRTVKVMRCQVRNGQVRPSQVRTGQVKSGQVKSRQVKSGLGLVRTGRVRTGQVRTINFLDPKWTWEWSLTLAFAQLVVIVVVVIIVGWQNIHNCWTWLWWKLCKKDQRHWRLDHWVSLKLNCCDGVSNLGWTTRWRHNVCGQQD